MQQEVIAKPTIVVDTREQLPYRFEHQVVEKLDYGDYSLLGLKNQVAVERKSKEDCYQSFGQERARFEQEIEQLGEFDYGAILVETNIQDLIKPPKYSKLSPAVVSNSLLSWSAKYGVYVWFGGDRRHSKALVKNLLEKYWRFVNDELKDFTS